MLCNIVSACRMVVAQQQGIAVSELARGSLVQFVDADDLLLSKKLEEQVPMLADASMDVVYADEGNSEWRNRGSL